MSADLELVLSKVENLELNELLMVQEKVLRQMKTKSSTAPSKGQSELKVKLPHAYRRTPEEVEASLASIFTSEELKNTGKTNFDSIQIGPKSASELLNEDREDRF
jgi:hypothetical protein